MENQESIKIINKSTDVVKQKEDDIEQLILPDYGWPESIKDISKIFLKYLNCWLSMFIFYIFYFVNTF